MHTRVEFQNLNIVMQFTHGRKKSANHPIYPIFLRSVSVVQLWATGSTYNTGNKNEG